MYSIKQMRARHPGWFREDLERLFGLLAERVSFDEVADAHRRLEAGVSSESSSYARTFRRDAIACRHNANRAPLFI